MATSFKALNNQDITNSKTKLHEAIPLTGTILSGTYSDNNIKNYPHGMFQSVYDYPYLSSSANHIIDLTAGFATDSALSSSVNVSLRNKKNDIYNEMSQMLAGYNSTGSINKLDVSGNFGSTVAADKIEEALVFNLARLLTKDEIQKVSGGGFNITLGVSSSYATPFAKTLTVYDKDGVNAKTNSPAGEFNVLYATGSGFAADSPRPCGLLFYQAGVAVLTSSVFKSDFVEACEMDSAGEFIDDLLVSGSISGTCDSIRHRVQNISFSNTTELNSTIYFARLDSSDFNYSSNPTYLSSSQIRVKEAATDNPVSYVTTVGLYSADDALLAVAKVSEPLKKTPAAPMTLRVRLDY
tara:strand:- start:1510 stop:2568 length:1059 start_codon:yes stop_codon:yes gene_type:complete